ncbi:MAG: glycosyltransferase [Halofilum sp. (in: g-proteobacteria)]|nr:glycosyltransferase [Halofilum sp. (in: g-proteobacteria)]
MRICLLSNTYSPHVGGVARSVETLAEQCRAAGHEVLVVAPSFPGDRHERAPDVLRVPAWQNFNGSDFSVRVPVPKGIRARIRRFRPDVLHSHHPFLMGDTALRIAYALNLPLVFTHHTLYEQYTHYVPFDSPALKRFVIELATEYANACDAVIAPSGSIARLLHERGVETAVHVIPTGIDADAFGSGSGERFRRERGIPEDAVVIGHVGRLAREKNLPFLAAAVAEALGRDPRAWFLVVGDGPESTAVQRAVTAAGGAGRLLMTGKLTAGLLHDAYAAMDLFAFASQSETQGMVLCEAMAAGLPVVALDGPGVRDVLEDGVNGRLLAAESGASELAEALLGLAEDAATRSRWSQAARRTAGRYDRARCAAEVLALYDSLRQAAVARPGDWSWWDRLLGRVEAEWELISAKAESAGRGLKSGGRRGHRSTE